MRLLQDGAAQQAQRRPEATAIIRGDRRLSFRELEECSNRLARALRDRLSAMLPAYMVPSRWAQYDAHPRIANGKIDLDRLPEFLAYTQDA